LEDMTGDEDLLTINHEQDGRVGGELRVRCQGILGGEEEEGGEASTSEKGESGLRLKVEDRAFPSCVTKRKERRGGGGKNPIPKGQAVVPKNKFRASVNRSRETTTTLSVKTVEATMRGGGSDMGPFCQQVIPRQTGGRGRECY